MNYTFSSLLVDIALVVIMVVTIVSFIRKGFLAGTVNLVGKVASLLIAWFVSSRLAPAVFENFFKTGITTQTSQTIQASGTASVEGILNSLSGFIPQSFIDRIAGSVSGTFDAAAPNIAQTIVEQVIMPLMIPVISIVVFFITYALCRLLISFLVAALLHVNKVPLVGGVNKLLGGLLGVLAGALNIFIVLCAILAVLIITGDAIPFFNHSTLQESWFYSFFANNNPFFTA